MVHYKVSTVHAETVWTLPDDIACQIGHITSKWACLERMVRLCVFNMVPIEEPAGRVVIGTARQADQLQKLQDLLMIRNIKIAFDIDSLKKRVSGLEVTRDKYVHGNWLRDKSSETLRILDIGGKWNLGRDAPRVTKRMFPAGEPITVDQLKAVSQEIGQATDSLKALLNDLVQNAQPTLTKILLERIRLQILSADQTQNTPADQPPPSQE